MNLTGIETAFREFNITVDVIKGKSLEWPRIETPAHWLTLGYDQDLTKALDILKSETVKFIAEQRKVAPAEAQRIMMQGWDCRISEWVDIVKGTFCFNAKDVRAKPPAPLPGKETATDYVTVSSNADLNKAMDGASMAMINLIAEKRNLIGSMLMGWPAWPWIAASRRPPAAKSAFTALSRKAYGERKRGRSEILYLIARH